MKVWKSNDVGNDIIILSLAVYLGTVLTGFFRAFSKDILYPMLAKIFPAYILEEFHIGKVYIGDFLLELLNLLVAFAMVILFAKFARRYAGHLLQHLYM